MAVPSIRSLAVVLAVPCCLGAAHGQSLSFTEVSSISGINVLYEPPVYSFYDYSGGGAVGDFNGDGWQDLFLFSGGAGDAPDKLYINDGDGTFTESAAAWGMTAAQRGRGATVGDFNNDGHLDLFQTTEGLMTASTVYRGRLWRNNGNDTFTEIAASAGVRDIASSSTHGFGATFGDYDLDGDLDLYVAAFNGHEENRLYRNNGDETFTDVTDAIGLFDSTPNQISGMSPQFLDMDGDRYPELLLVADFGTSRYFRNNGNGTFSDITGPAGTSQESDGMGSAVGDFNRDGRPDWYVTSIDYSFGGPCNGNTLYLNLGGHTYDEVACDRGVVEGGWGWGTTAADFNHDGRLDIAETNGSPNNAAYIGVPSMLWIQDAAGDFDETAAAAGVIHNGMGRGLAQFDYDNDGDRDFVIMAWNERVKLFRNDLSGPDTNWLKVWLDTSGAPGLAPNGFGSVVSVTVGGETQTQYVLAQSNYLCASEFSSHFGLGAATVVDELRVSWVDGTERVLTNVAAGQTLTISYDDAPVPGDLDGNGVVGFADLNLLLAAWGPCPACPEDLDGNGTVGFGDLNLLLGNWG